MTREMLISASREELLEWNRRIIEELKVRSARAVHTFRPGQKVSFKGRSGQVYSGTVLKTNIKTVSVSVPGAGVWKVGPSLLSVDA